MPKEIAKGGHASIFLHQLSCTVPDHPIPPHRNAPPIPCTAVTLYQAHLASACTQICNDFSHLLRYPYMFSTQVHNSLLQRSGKQLNQRHITQIKSWNSTLQWSQDRHRWLKISIQKQVKFPSLLKHGSIAQGSDPREQSRIRLAFIQIKISSKNNEVQG
jgi:hypothetical protein